MKHNQKNTQSLSFKHPNSHKYNTTLNGDIRIFAPTDSGYVISRQTDLDTDTLVDAIGGILCYKLSHLYSDRTFSITYFLGFSSLSIAKSLGFEIKKEFDRQGIGSVVFMAYESPHFPGCFDLKFKVVPALDSSTESHFTPTFTPTQCEPERRQPLLTRKDLDIKSGRCSKEVSTNSINSAIDTTGTTEEVLSYLAKRGVFIYG